MRLYAIAWAAVSDPVSFAHLVGSARSTRDANIEGSDTRRDQLD
jgi:hypothetical protein